jgi:exportin-T
MYVLVSYVHLVNPVFQNSNHSPKSRFSSRTLIVLRNKAAQILTLLFSNVYPTVWPTFFDDLIALTEIPSKALTNATATEFFLRVSLSVDEEIARQDIQRSRDQVNRNTLLKDAMRERDIPKLAEKWFEILQEYRTRDSNIAELALRVIGSYVAWMDISLVVNDQVMTALYQMLAEEPLRIAACECLAEVTYKVMAFESYHQVVLTVFRFFKKVVSKGMKPLDKLSLIQMLNITDTLNQLDLVCDLVFSIHPFPPHMLSIHTTCPSLFVQSDSDFGEHVAKLINVLGCELCQIYADNDVPAEAKSE